MRFFINLKIFVNGEDWVPIDNAEFEGTFKSFMNMLNCLVFIQPAELYYSSSEMKKLIRNIEEIANLLKYDRFEFTRLRQEILNLEAKDWNEQQFHRNDHDYLLQLSGGYEPYSVKGTSVAEGTEYKHNDNDAIILNLNNADLHPDVVHVNRVSLKPPLKMDMVNINVFSSKETVVRYFLTNRGGLNFNYNPKHGQNRTEIRVVGGEVISPLECSENEASVLLMKSIGYKNRKELYAFDSVRNKFIEFKSENTINTYHGYHSHDQEEIPKEVRDFLRNNYRLF